METIGHLLKSLRLQQNLTLQDVSSETNIAPHLLEYLENDDYAHLPTSTYTKGFITTFASMVGLSSSKALAIFRRDFVVNESGKILPKGLAKPLDKPTVVTSRVLWLSGIVILICLFSGYLFYQLKVYQSPPKITVERPRANTLVKGPNVAVKGYVSADSSVYVNGNLVQVFPTGEFQAMTSLPPGEHIISIKAINAQQKIAQSDIPVTVDEN